MPRTSRWLMNSWHTHVPHYHVPHTTQARQQLMKTVPSSGYIKPAKTESGPAWLRDAAERLKQKKLAPHQRPKPKVAPDGCPMFKPQSTNTERAKSLRAVAPSSGYVMPTLTLDNQGVLSFLYQKFANKLRCCERGSVKSLHGPESTSRSQHK